MLNKRTKKFNSFFSNLGDDDDDDDEDEDDDDDDEYKVEEEADDEHALDEDVDLAYIANSVNNSSNMRANDCDD